MKSTVSLLFSLLLVILLIAVTSACTTSTKLVQSEILIDSSELRKDTTLPVKQSSEIKNITSAAIAPKNHQLSISQLIPLAEQGQADAQYSLGFKYYNGLGVPRNDSEAIKWLVSAAKQGHKNAIEALRRIALASNTSDQVTGAAEGFEHLPKIEIVDNNEPPVNKIQVASMSRLPEATTDTMAQTLTLGAISSLTKNEQWIMGQSGKHYTIQLVSTANKTAMLRFINKNNLRGNAVFYKTKRENDDWYTLILGSFESLSVAKKTVSRLSPTLQKNKPWVKPISSIQKALAIR